MFNEYRKNRIERKMAILKTQLKNLNSLGNTNSYYIDKALATADELTGLGFDLSRLEDKE